MIKLFFYLLPTKVTQQKISRNWILYFEKILKNVRKWFQVFYLTCRIFNENNKYLKILKILENYLKSYYELSVNCVWLHIISSY